ncbi:phosphocholine cytidylyltransferase family protein [Dickeya zeae]|uniref:Phosphocholine cytidylyltransferase family protein n=1 Tax=Dickeya zeae TaxID=204042 RepID=A0AAE6Z073_9GAMM|nr:phosphocholine cytidylyltransferase family protein [Dickeya zeae]MCO7261713.1 phosphocholine cytidylyltransferase family protein [Dickeya zeae]QIZ51000.1 phosphocholine cytidylyltransferase family protein [Dickeya zeae]QYM90792.1 phosphocholine cytidylyltransferase family protein [Dickeya zeae]
MKGILLVAGRGSRLGDITNEKPKSLVELNGQSLLQRAIDSLKKGGVDNIAAVGGYRSEMIEPYADRLFINGNWEGTSIFSSLLCAREWLKTETCIISYGDIFYSHHLVESLIKSTGDINLTYDPNAVELWKKRNEDPLSDLESFRIDNGRIVGIGGRIKSLDEVQGQYMGLFKITPQAWSWIENFISSLSQHEIENIDMTNLFSKLINSGHHVFGTKNEYPWGEIDTPSDISLYHKIYPNV